MADHQQEMIEAAAAAATGTTSHGHGVDWWSTAVSCSPHQLPARWPGPADGNSSTSGNAAACSSGSPGSHSFATGVSPVAFRESAAVHGAAAVAVPQPVAGTFANADWSQPYYLDNGSGFHGFMSSIRNDQAGHMNAPTSLTRPSSNNSPSTMMPQDPHDQNHQFLSNLGLDLLSSPTSPPSSGFRSTSLLRSLTEPAAAVAKPPSSGFQHHQQQQTTMNHAPGSIREALQFSNNTHFWNPSGEFGVAADGLASLGTTTQSLGQSRPASSLADKSPIIAKKANTDRTPLKKARTGRRPSSPLPTFKVRKEKLGDRITALQQLVSPFGKTDTASVLHETIEYIKFLHEQVGSLSAPYLKNSRQQVAPHLKISRDGGEAAAAAAKGDLTGRGLCLVPISSTFAVASETPVDFWTPFGAAFR